MKDRNKTSITTNDLPIKEILEQTVHTHKFNTNPLPHKHINHLPPTPTRYTYTLPPSPHLPQCRELTGD